MTIFLTQNRHLVFIQQRVVSRLGPQQWHVAELLREPVQAVVSGGERSLGDLPVGGCRHMECVDRNGRRLASTVTLGELDWWVSDHVRYQKIDQNVLADLQMTNNVQKFPRQPVAVHVTIIPEEQAASMRSLYRNSIVVYRPGLPLSGEKNP